MCFMKRSEDFIVLCLVVVGFKLVEFVVICDILWIVKFLGDDFKIVVILILVIDRIIF